MPVETLIDTLSSTLLGEIIESATDFVTVSPAVGKPRYVNRAARRAFGIGDTEEIESLFAFRPAGFEAHFETLILPALRSDGSWTGETEYVSRSGQVIPVSQVSVAHKSDTGELEFVSTISRNITKDKARDAHLRQAQKMEAVGQLIGGVAHDFNNLLTTILGYTDLAIHDLGDAHPSRTDLDEVKRAGEAAVVLTRQLLSFSRRRVFEPQTLQLGDVVTGLLPMLRRLLGKQIEVIEVLDPEPCSINADPGQVEQILMNLAINARDAMPQGGRLTIRVARPPGGGILLEVIDTGVGMDRSILASIFEPFFTTKEDGRGTGLGLSIVDEIVKKVGGLISVVSSPGHGTTFGVSFPRVESAAAPPETAATGLSTCRGSETILFVEDDAAIRELTTAVLERAGYQVIAAETSNEAIHKAAAVRGPIHMVITDVMMPGGTGAQLAMKLAAGGLRGPALFISGYEPALLVRQGNLEEGSHFLQKPFTGSALLAKVRQLLESAALAMSA